MMILWSSTLELSVEELFGQSVSAYFQSNYFPNTGITWAQLAKFRSIADVEVAAPLAIVGLPIWAGGGYLAGLLWNTPFLLVTFTNVLAPCTGAWYFLVHPGLLAALGLLRVF